MNVKAYFDGACPQNPGCVGGWGFVIEGDIDEYGFGRITHPKPTVTNNVAEYTALVNLLQTLRDLGASSPTIYGDSQMVVNMASRKWGKRGPHKNAPHLRDLLFRCRDLIDSIGADVRWIPRQKNQKADEISKWAIEELV